jgi:hypothetical protein
MKPEICGPGTAPGLNHKLRLRTLSRRSQAILEDHAMDAARFDTLTRLIGSRTSRRVLVGLAASGLLGIAVPDAEAAKCSNKKPCPECYQCKKHKCKPLTETACTNGTCQSGVCITPPPPPPPECVSHADCGGGPGTTIGCFLGRCCRLASTTGGSYSCGDGWFTADCCANTCCAGHCYDGSGFGLGKNLCPGTW